VSTLLRRLLAPPLLLLLLLLLLLQLAVPGCPVTMIPAKTAPIAL